MAQLYFSPQPDLSSLYLKKVFRILILSVLLPVVALGQLPTEFQKVELLTGLKNSINFEFAPDGRVFILDRYGEIIIFKPDSQTSVSAGTINVFHDLEDGLLAIEFDPDFENNHYIYLHYSPASVSVNRVSRFQMNGDLINTSSESIILEWPTQRACCYHAAGDLAFDSQGNLYIATGDNSNHSAYATLNESDPNESSENTSSNTNDLRGKILRIKPLPNGTYSIPAGNLFPSGAGGLPEIYVMGARNPFKIFVDKSNTDWLFWGEVGPDANFSSNLGPEGMDEINLTKGAGNYGWPYFSGKNEPYLNTYTSPNFYYDPNNPVNLSRWNTGSDNLPPAKPSWLEFFHECYLAGPRYYFDPAIANSKKLPPEFDEVFFYFDFNDSKIWAAKLDNNGNILSTERFATGIVTGAGFIDLKIGPDGQLYILEYGAGCCPGNTGTGKLVRVDFIGVNGNHTPIVNISADKTSGSLPLTVHFSSDGTSDLDGDALIYNWDFQPDGIVDSNQEDPTFTYTQAGIYNPQLRVDDSNGGVSSKSIQIHAGNNAATFAFIYPPDGGMVNWFDSLDYHVVVNDLEDGSTSNSTIDCQDLNIVPSLGHLNHFHDDLTINKCDGTLLIDGTGHNTDGQDDIFFVINVNYTDASGLKAFDQIKLHPKVAEAEFYDVESNTHLIDNTDEIGGGKNSVRALSNNSYIVLEDRNLANINAVSYRVASTLGGTIEMRIGSPTGTLLNTAQVPNTGSLASWTNAEVPVTDPGGKHDLYFVFKSNLGSANLFDLNFIEFKGTGVSTDDTPATVISVNAASQNQIRIKFNEPLNESSAEQKNNYTINNGISISSAVLQDDRRTVFLSTSTISEQVRYNLVINNLENENGIVLNQSITESFIFNDALYRINSGGPSVELEGFDWTANNFNNAGSTYSASLPINNTTLDELYHSTLYGNFTYNIPVPQSGFYKVVLHFAELYHGIKNSKGVGARRFNVDIEHGQFSLNGYDIIEQAGAPATAVIEEFDGIQVVNGFLTLAFSGVVDHAMVSAIEVFHGEEQPAISIVSPTNGKTVVQPFEITFELTNWEIEAGGKHIHMIIDGVDESEIYSTDPISVDNLSFGNHSIRLELANADHTPTQNTDQIQVNVVEELICPETEFPLIWAEQVIGTAVPYRSVYIFSEDIDGDGYKDIVLGAWWYENPGSPTGNWTQHIIGAPMNNMSLLHDFDNDGDIDIFGTQGTYISAKMAWAENDGSGNFTIHTNIPDGTSTYNETFMAGAVIGNFNQVANTQIALTWNGAERVSSPVQMLTVPADPVNQPWTINSISPDSYGEAISAGDIDGDGDLDLFQGINWLRNDNGSWTTFPTGITLPTEFDRNQLVDIDNNGVLDGIVNQIGVNQEISWFHPPIDPTQPWTKSTIGTDVDGGLSLDVADMDGDGDLDIITGEWNDAHRLIAFENDLCNSGTWIKRILHPGGSMDHHDGTQTVDIDNDGDLDIISLGWDQRFPRIYRNNSSFTLTSLHKINSGGTAFSYSGENWEVDKLFTGGSVYNYNTPIAGTGNDQLYRALREGNNVTYNIPVATNGPFSVILHFAELYHGVLNSNGAGSRLFNVNIENNQGRLTNYDVFVQAGGAATAVTETFSNLTVNDGSLTITFTSVLGNAIISGIEVFAINDPINHPPVITNPGTISYAEGASVNLQMNANDPNPGDLLTYAATGLPASLSINSSSGLISGTLSVAPNSYSVTVTVTDEDGLSDQETFNLIVTDGSIVIVESINAGGPSFSYNGETWGADEYFSGGGAFINATPISGTQNDQLYQSLRNTSSFSYNIPVSSNGPFSVALHFAEIWHGVKNSNGAGSRLFNVNIENGQGQLSNYDVIAQAGGPATAVVETFDNLTVNDGQLTISFTGVVDKAIISAIVVTTSTTAAHLPPVLTNPGNITYSQGATVNLQIEASDPDSGDVLTYQANGLPASLSINSTTGLISGTLTATPGSFPVTVIVTDSNGLSDQETFNITVTGGSSAFLTRINAGGAAFSLNGENWGADQFSDGGGSYTNNTPIAGTVNDQLYQSLRNTSSFTYNIPVSSSGPFSVTLHFAEIWHGVKNSNGVGSRLFNVIIENGQAQLTNYDVIAEAGGPATAVVETFNNLTVNDGQLTISFTGVVDKAFVSGIEVSTTNLPPVVINPGTMTFPEGAAVNFQIEASDPDADDVLTYAATGLPASLSINPTTGIINGTLSASPNTYTVAITVTDNHGLSDDVGFDITVTGATDPTHTNINTGGSQFSFDGKDWDADHFMNGGKIYSDGTLSILGTFNDQLYRTTRYGNFSYNIPVNSTGPFTVRLHFAEIYHGVKNTLGIGARVFNVNVENSQGQLSNYDIIEAAGGSATAIAEVIDDIIVNDGNLTITFSKVVDNALISGIEVFPTTASLNNNFKQAGTIENTHESKNLIDDNIKIYPNPARDHLNVELYLLADEKITFEMFDVMGNRFDLGTHYLESGFSKIKLNLSSIQSKRGMYFLKLSSKKYAKNGYRILIDF